MKFLGSLVAMGLVVLSANVVTAMPVPMQPAGTESPTPPVTPAQQMSLVFHRAPDHVALPDSVLARVYFAKGTTDISRRQFADGAAQLELPPGPLTPEIRRQVLDLLVEKRILATRALREPRDWAHLDSVSYKGLVDRLTLRAALDSAMVDLGFKLAARGDTLPDPQAMGIMLRDSAMAILKPTYDEDGLKLVAAAFAALPKPGPGMSPQEQMRIHSLMPSVSAADSARLLIRSSLGDYTIGQLLNDFGRLNSGYRPSVQTAEQVRDVANSVIYETILRQNAVKQDLLHKPSIAAQLAERAEFLDVQSFVRHATYQQVPVDSATLRRHYDRHRHWFDTWGRVDIVRGIFKLRSQADSLAKLMAQPGMADSLLTRRMPDGRPYATSLAESADTALFSRLRRAGTTGVVGPDETQDGWRVIRAMHFEPRHERAFGDVIEVVHRDWFERDGERRVRELMQKLVDSTLVQVNEAALASAGAHGASRRAPRGMPGAGAHSR